MLIIVTPEDIDYTSKGQIKLSNTIDQRILEKATHVVYTDGDSVSLLKSRYGKKLTNWMATAALSYYNEKLAHQTENSHAPISNS